jgi:hypothetical protein
MPTVGMRKTIVFINSGSCVQIAYFLSIRSQYGQSNQMAGDSGHVGTVASGKGDFVAGQWEGWRIQRAANEKAQ